MFGGKKKEPSVDQEIKTLISAGTIFEGNITVPEGITRIDGKVVGNINGNGCVIIGESGSVKGDLSVDSLIAYGEISGNIKARSVELKNGSKVLGNLEVSELYVEKGAIYNGECRMVEGFKENP